MQLFRHMRPRTHVHAKRGGAREAAPKRTPAPRDFAPRTSESERASAPRHTCGDREHPERRERRPRATHTHARARTPYRTAALARHTAHRAAKQPAHVIGGDGTTNARSEAATQRRRRARARALTPPRAERRRAHRSMLCPPGCASMLLMARSVFRIISRISCGLRAVCRLWRSSCGSLKTGASLRSAQVGGGRRHRRAASHAAQNRSAPTTRTHSVAGAALTRDFAR